MTDISIIIPTRNRLWSLPKAVGSCRSSLLQIEIIVVDDGSTDGTKEWLLRSDGLIYLSGDGWGKPWAVNKALAHATGKYIRFLDSDDWLNPGANEEQFQLGETYGAEIVISGVDVFNDDTFIERHKLQKTDDFISQQLGEEFNSHYSSFLFRRDFIKDIPHRAMFPAGVFPSRDDRCFVLEVSLKNPRIAHHGGAALCHRHHAGDRLQRCVRFSNVGADISYLFIYKQICRLLEEAGEFTPRRRAAIARPMWFLAHWIAKYDLAEAIALVRWLETLGQSVDPSLGPVERKFYSWFGFRNVELVRRVARIFGAPFRSMKI